MHVTCPCPDGWHTGLADDSIFKCSWKSVGSWQSFSHRKPKAGPSLQAPQKLFLCWQVRSIPGLFTCLKVFCRHGFLKQNAFVLPNIPYVCVSLSVMSSSVTPWTIGHQAPLSMEFSRQEYWSGLQFPSAGDLPHPGVKHRSPALQADSTIWVTRNANTSRESSPPLRLILGRFLG